MEQKEIKVPDIRAQLETELEWSIDSANIGDKVKMLVNVIGFPEGTPVTFMVYEYDANGKHDLVQDDISGELQNGHAEAEWQFQDIEDPDEDLEFEDAFEKTYNPPEFIFDVKIKDKVFRCDKILRFSGGPMFVDEEGEPIEDMNALAYLPDGRVIPSKIINGYLTEPYLWQSGKIQFHLVADDVGGIK